MADPVDVVVTFTAQQLDLIDRQIAARDDLDDRLDLVRAAIAGAAGPAAPFSPRSATVARKERPVTSETTIEPGTGRAFEVRRGQVVRVSQTVGGQCADFNLFNLDNRHEHLHVGRTRSLHGNSPTTGDFVWSNAPWERPLMVILQDTAKTDTEFPSCSAQLYWRFYGERHHTNCQQMQTEAQREYGLSPHEVHESLNLFMYCAYDDPDHPEVRPNRSTAQDFVELLALHDVLAVFNVCGDDFDRTNNFTFTDLTVTVMDSDDADRDRAAGFESADHPDGLLESPYSEQTEGLVRDPGYVPAYPHAPVRFEPVTFRLSPAEAERLRGSADVDLYGADLGAALRDIAVSWTIRQTRVPASR